jgi:alpha-mannosidase
MVIYLPQQSTDETPLPPEGAGFLDTSGSDVVLSTWKEAEDGNGMVLRFMETAGAPVQETVRFDRSKILSAHLCSGVETAEASLPVENNSVQLSFKPFEVVTVRVKLTPLGGSEQ